MVFLQSIFTLPVYELAFSYIAFLERSIQVVGRRSFLHFVAGKM